MSLGLETVYEQGSHGKGNSYPNHTCPPLMLPRQTGNECTGRTTQKVNDHINGIDTIDGRCVKGDYAGLIRQMDALHTGINQQDSNYYPQIAVTPQKCQYPCSQHYASSGNREEPRTVLLDVAADEKHRGCSCQSTQTECSDNVVTSKKRFLFHPKSKATPQSEERAISQCRPQRCDTQVGVLVGNGKSGSNCHQSQQRYRNALVLS